MDRVWGLADAALAAGVTLRTAEGVERTVGGNRRRSAPRGFGFWNFLRPSSLGVGIAQGSGPRRTVWDVRNRIWRLSRELGWRRWRTGRFVWRRTDVSTFLRSGRPCSKRNAQGIRRETKGLGQGGRRRSMDTGYLMVGMGRGSRSSWRVISGVLGRKSWDWGPRWPFWLRHRVSFAGDGRDSGGVP